MLYKTGYITRVMFSCHPNKSINQGLNHAKYTPNVRVVEVLAVKWKSRNGPCWSLWENSDLVSGKPYLTQVYSDAIGCLKPKGKG